MNDWFGVLAGLAFTGSFATFGIFGGLIADRYNRTLVIGFACIAWSVCTLLTGLIDSFALLFALRFGLGMFESVFNPCAYSILADFYHPDHRTLANSLFNSGIYLGGALASLSTLIITHGGWRLAYAITGAIGIGMGILSLLFVREPVRNFFAKKAAAATPAAVNESERVA